MKRKLVNLFQLLQSTYFYRIIRKTKFVDLYLIPLIEKTKYLQREISDDDIFGIIINNKPVIFEIGSDSGSDTVKFCNMFPKGIVYSFEPDPRNISVVKEKTKDIRNLIFVEKALSNINGVSTFNLSSSEKGGGKGSSSLKKPNLTTKVFPTIQFKETCNVDCIKLDDFVTQNKIDYIDLVWMDVQGAEDLVIDGGIETFQKRVKYLYTEFSNLELYSTQINLEQILEKLKVFEIQEIYTSNVLLRNINLND
jgi:FkbM family methyltransferase